MIKLLRYNALKESLVLILLLVGIYPMLRMVLSEPGPYHIQQWSFWLFFYSFSAMAVILFALTQLFNAVDSTKEILFLTFFIALSTLLRMIPLPLGMSMAFLIPILIGGLVHPWWGVLIGVFSMLLSSLISGGLGPWVPVQVFLFMLIPACLLWVPREIVSKRIFLMFYAGFWGILYGFLMTTYFWPIVSIPLNGKDWASFATFYFATSFLWDVFRAFGNVLFVGMGYPIFARVVKDFL